MYTKITFFLDNQSRWGDFKSIKYLKSLILDDPYNPILYLFIFPILYKKKRFLEIERIFKEATQLIPHSLKIKELLFFILSHYQYKSVETADYLLNDIVPLIQNHKGSRFLLYCISVYFMKRKILDSALFYSQLSIDPLLKQSRPYLINQYYFLAYKLKDQDLIKEIISSKAFSLQKDSFHLVKRNWYFYHKIVFLENDAFYNLIQISDQKDPRSDYILKDKKPNFEYYLNIFMVILLVIVYCLTLVFIAWK